MFSGSVADQRGHIQDCIRQPNEVVSLVVPFSEVEGVMAEFATSCNGISGQSSANINQQVHFHLISFHHQMTVAMATISTDCTSGLQAEVVHEQQLPL